MTSGKNNFPSQRQKRAGLLTGLYGMLFPKTCCGCGNSLYSGENQLCLFCIANLPKTNLHNLRNNKIEKKFWGRLDIKAGTAFLYFHKRNNVQRLIHALKYNNNQEVGRILGTLFGRDLRQSEFANSDCVLPVPLHPSKLELRGYNQCVSIATGISSALGIPVDTESVSRIIANPSQTRKSRYERWKNVENIFSAAVTLSGKKVLLIDDVITTGSTLEACGHAILKTGARELRVATLACA